MISFDPQDWSDEMRAAMRLFDHAVKCSAYHASSPAAEEPSWG